MGWGPRGSLAAIFEEGVPGLWGWAVSAGDFRFPKASGLELCSGTPGPEKGWLWPGGIGSKFAQVRERSRLSAWAADTSGRTVPQNPRRENVSGNSPAPEILLGLG